MHRTGKRSIRTYKGNSTENSTGIIPRLLLNNKMKMKIHRSRATIYNNKLL